MLLLDELLAGMGRLYMLAVEMVTLALTPIYCLIAWAVRPRDQQAWVVTRLLPAAARRPPPYPISLHMDVKTLVLDLDETLVHSFHSHPIARYDMTLRVVIDNTSMKFYVRFRPHVRLFLETVALWYEVVIFTASLQQYGNPVIDALDRGRRLVNRRLFRDSCTMLGPVFAKDLARVQPDLARVLIIDNSPGAYSLHPDNAVPIRTWTSDARDTELLRLLPFLDALRHTADVRSVLSLRPR